MKFRNIFLFRVEAFDEHDLESKFIALSLAFKTDRATLNKRLELHKRQRDMAEKNVENEFQSMRDHLCALNLKATSSDVRDLISKIQNHLDIAQQATSRVSGRSETYGAVQQEERVSRAFEVLVLHVDHLKRLFDKEHKELEDTRRMLTDTRGFRKEVASDVVSEDQKKYSKTLGLPLGSIKSEPKAASFPSASSVSVSSNSLPPSPSKSSTRISTQGRRCSLPAASPVSTPSLPPISQKSFGRKKERSTWTRKLSSVTDEKEEIEPSSLDSRIFEEMSQEQFMLRAFLQQVERKNHEFCKHVENELDELPDETDSADDKTILNCIQNSAVGSFLSTPVIQELWQQNSTCTLARYFCSTILAFIALYFLLSLILPCVGFIPEVIANLSQAEQKLISRIIPFVKIIKSSGVFGQYSFGGQAVLFSQDDFEVTENLPNMLPRSSNNAEMAVVSERLKNIKEMR
ncbi:lymphoid-restricted membrane protein [Trichonephila inaurata madagascariensis]|nr:lymphoid-restricted membrane protein [Trichonephila inaurata madagascariensis]